MTRLLVVVLLATAACGVRNQPLAPELVQPEPPSALVAKSLAEGVRLTWRRPLKDSGGKSMRDLQGFDIERADGGESVDYTHVGTFELTDQTRFQKERVISFTDTSAVANATYRYRIIAYTLDGYRSAPSESLVVTHRVSPATAAPSP
jgi:hypothetical protein